MTSKKKTSKKKSTALANYDEQLAQFASEEADREASVGGGQFFSIRGGVLKFDGAALPGNEFVGVVLDAVMENVYYEGKFDPDNPSSPACYAFGRDEESIAPHEMADQPQSERCLDCDNNQWGSADTGRGKACRNRRRLAIIPGGTIDRDGVFAAYEDLDHYEKAAAGFMAIPPTSLTSWARYVKDLKATKKVPSFAVFTKITLVPDAKNQFALQFEYVDSIPQELIPTVIERHKAMRELIEFPYAKITTAAAAQSNTKMKGQTRRAR